MIGSVLRAVSRVWSMRQQVHDQGQNAEAQGELECEDRAAGRDGDQPAPPGPGPADVLEAGPAPGGPLGHRPAGPSSRAREAKPSAAISCRKPKWLVRKAAEAGTSATLRDTAEAVICTGELLGPGGQDGNQQRTSYSVLRTTNARGRMFPCPPSTAAAATPHAPSSCSGASPAPRTP